MLVGRRQDLGHSPAWPMAMTFLLRLNFPSWQALETNPQISGLTPSNSLENRGALSEPGVEEKSLLLMKNRGLETGKSRFLSRPSLLLAQRPGVGCLTSSRLNFLICEMVTEVASTYTMVQLGVHPDRRAWHVVGAQCVCAKSLQSHPTL